MRTNYLAAVVLGLLCVAALADSPAPMSEKQKIDALIATVKNLKDATFIRNGKEYDGDAAAKHMRDKLDYAGDKIKTATDFIDQIASKSSVSGKPYLIKFKDGTEQTAGDFLKARLDEIEHPKPTSQPTQ